MENIKEKIPMIIAIIVAVVICGVVCYFFEYYEAYYYTQIDNTKIQKVSASDEMKYEYTLDCYQENGKEKQIKFKTSRELKQDAYLKLEVKMMGVHSWEEVSIEELPNKVKENYRK